MDRTTITEIFMEVCRKHNSILEDIQIQPNYVTVKVLVPIDVAVGVVIEDGISHCICLPPKSRPRKGKS
jgi:hypothetical protein